MAVDDERIIEGIRRQALAREALLAGGATHLGWKSGFGADASRLTLAIVRPLIGFLTTRTLVEPKTPEGPSVTLGDWSRAIVEAEVAVWLGADLAAGVSADEALAAVAGVAPAIELADIDVPLGPDAVADVLAGDIFHRVVMLGTKRPTLDGWPTGQLRAHIMHVPTGGDITEVEVDDVEALPGTTAEILVECAAIAALIGPGLRAGDVVILGSVMPPIPMAPGGRFAYELRGHGRLAVRGA